MRINANKIANCAQVSGVTLAASGDITGDATRAPVARSLSPTRTWIKAQTAACTQLRRRARPPLFLHSGALDRAAFLPSAQATMPATENRHLRAAGQQNGGAMAEASTVEDVFDDTYREKDGPKPQMRLVWRNIILMSLLHAGALYGLVLLPSASGLTLVWSEYLPHTVAGLSWADLLWAVFPPTAECADAV